MSTRKVWTFKTKQEAIDFCEGYRNHPFVSPGAIVQDGDVWVVEVRYWECD
jgi:hypothetical protein